MITTRRRPTKRNAPRLAGTERIGNFLLTEILIGHTRAVNNPDLRSSHHVGEFFPAGSAHAQTVTTALHGVANWLSASQTDDDVFALVSPTPEFPPAPTATPFADATPGVLLYQAAISVKIWPPR